MFFNTNIKRLRLHTRKTQDVAAAGLGIARSSLNSYENGYIENPTQQVLVKISDYYQVSIDMLIRIDLRERTDYSLKQIQLNFQQQKQVGV